MIREHFQGLTAPRIGMAQRHNLPDILALTLCAVLCGADHGGGIAELPNGIPSPDTLGRVFSRPARATSLTRPYSPAAIPPPKPPTES